MKEQSFTASVVGAWHAKPVYFLGGKPKLWYPLQSPVRCAVYARNAVDGYRSCRVLARQARLHPWGKAQSMALSQSPETSNGDRWSRASHGQETSDTP